MKLLIVESPAKAKTIEKYLGKDFRVISSYGHIRKLPSIKGAVNTEENFSINYHIIDKAQERVKLLRNHAKEAEEIFLATDPDREGEAISWHISEIIKNDKSVNACTPIKRVVFYEITKQVIVTALENAREIDMDLVKAQQARQALDYLVGFTLSPILWRKLPGSRSAGRVQSVALKILCDRENEIDLFEKKEYYSIVADFHQGERSFSADLIIYDKIKLEKFSITNKKRGDSLKNILKDLSYIISGVVKKTIHKNPNAPFTTSTLIQEGATKLNFSAKKTMMIAQKLYEGINIGSDITGLITYLRTDSVTISKIATEEVRQFIVKEYGIKYLSPKINYYQNKIKNAQEAHEAIRPTDFNYPPENIKQYLDADQHKLYKIIWERTVSSQMASVKLESVTIEISDGSCRNVFKAVASVVIFNGFNHLYKKDNSTKKIEEVPSHITKEDILKLENVKVIQHFTQPPSRYTEASLVKKMEELGIGRPSTYPIILSILVDREYAKMDKKRFFTQSRGRLVDAFLGEFFNHYVDYDFTANLENDLDLIANGTRSFVDIMNSFWVSFKETSDKVMEVKNVDVVSKIEASLIQQIFRCINGKELSQLRICPTCKEGEIGVKTGKFGAFLGCSEYPTCSYKRGLFNELKEDSNGKTGELVLKEDGVEIFLKKGPYGHYLQQEINGQDKRVPLPSSLKKENLTPVIIKKLIALPKLLGVTSESKSKIFVKVGKFGAYLECDKKFYSLTSLERIDITADEAVDYMNNYKRKKPIKSCP